MLATLSEAWEGTNQATYSYLANSPLVDHITFANGGTTRMVSTRQFDYLNRLTSAVSTTNSVNFVRHNYAYNTASQRTQNTREDGSYWQFEYDSHGRFTQPVKPFPCSPGLTPSRTDPNGG